MNGMETLFLKLSPLTVRNITDNNKIATCSEVFSAQVFTYKIYNMTTDGIELFLHLIHFYRITDIWVSP